MLIGGWEVLTNSMKIERSQNLMIPQYFTLDISNISNFETVSSSMS